MTWHEQQRLADVLLIGEITAVATDGGEAPLRDRVAALSENGRRLLQDALDAVPT
jgi:hypothetical protein